MLQQGMCILFFSSLSLFFGSVYFEGHVLRFCSEVRVSITKSIGSVAWKLMKYVFTVHTEGILN